jgi:hypothetical protein
LVKKGIAASVEIRFRSKLKEIEREKAQALALIEKQRTPHPERHPRPGMSIEP